MALANVTIIVDDAPANMVAPRVLIVGRDGDLVRVPLGNSRPYTPDAPIYSASN